MEGYTKLKADSYSFYQEKLERIANEKKFNIMDQKRKLFLPFKPKNIRITKKILMTLITAAFQSIVAILAGIIYVANTYI